MISVSVAMATYNGAKFIREQLESLAAQTRLPDELVVTDDGSSDDTVAIVRDFAATAPFLVRVYENGVRLGYRANFMNNVGLCQSETIALCDQDDVWEPQKIERLAAHFADPEVVLCYHDSWIMQADGKRTGVARLFRLPPVNPPLSFYSLRNPFGFSIVFRRSLLEFSHLWDLSVDSPENSNRMAHDQWLFFLASVFGTIIFDPELLVNYRQHGHNTYGVKGSYDKRLSKVANWIKRNEGELLPFSVAARARAEILEQARNSLSGPWQERARIASAQYARLADDFAARSRVFSGRHPAARLAAWVEAVQSGAYSNRASTTAGWKGAFKDLFCTAVPRKPVRLEVQESVAGEADRTHDFRAPPPDRRGPGSGPVKRSDPDPILPAEQRTDLPACASKAG